MSPVVRKFVIAAMIVVLVPAAAMVFLGFLRWFGLGLRMEDEKTKTQYLIGAAENKARGEVERLLKLGIVAANAEDEFGYTALMGAAQGGDVDIVRMLIDSGASINATVRKSGAPRTPMGLTALMLTAQQGHFEAARLLLDRGADPNPAIPEGDFKGQTALFMAVLGGHLALVDAFLAKGARVDAQYVSPAGVFFIPLTVALRDNRLDIAERLVAHRANVDWLVPSGEFAGCTQLMVLATFRGAPASEQTITWLARRTKLGMHRPLDGGCRGQLAFGLAVSAGNIAAVKGMLSPTVKGIVGRGMVDQVFLGAYYQGAIEAKNQPMADLLWEHFNRCKQQPDCRVPGYPDLEKRGLRDVHVVLAIDGRMGQ
jgi:hypothetical protein